MTLASVNKPINLHYFYSCIHIFYFFYVFIIYVFWAGPSSAHMGWARPSQPGPVTGPSQWPGRAKATRVQQATRVAAPLHSVLLISWNRTEGRGSGLPWLAEGDEEDDKAPSVWLNHAWQGTLSTFPCVLLSGFCVSFASGYLAYYPGSLRWRNEDDGNAGGSFFLFAGGDQEDGDVNVGILGFLLAFISVFALYTVFFVSVFWVSFFFASPGFFFSFSLSQPLGSALFFPVLGFFFPPVLLFFSPPRSLIFYGFIARECQASLQLKRLQSHYCRNRSCGRRRRRRCWFLETAPFVWWEWPFAI